MADGEDADEAEQPIVEDEVEPPTPWDMLYAESLKGTLTNNGTMVEYEIEGVSISNHIDPHSGQRVTTNAEGLLTFEADGGSMRVCIHADGTRHIWEESKLGYRVSVERERCARVTVVSTVNGSEKHVNMLVECADGTKLEVVPQSVSLQGEHIHTDPTMANPLSSCTNASVLLRRKDGTIVKSRGSGEVNIASGFDVAARGEKECLSAVEPSGIYTAFCSQDMIGLTDNDGNFFEVRGDQSANSKLVNGMSGECNSPRCTKPSIPFQHPNAVSCPVPDDAPQPRLFVVYGDGEAEELLVSRDATEAMRIAKSDTECVVVEGEHLGPPMESCICHTVFRSASSDTVSVPPHAVPMPPSVASFHPGTNAFAPASGRSFTEFRQFTEYPQISKEQLVRFKEVLKQYHEQEERLRAQKAAYGQGLNSRKLASSVSPEKGGGA